MEEKKDANSVIDDECTTNSDVEFCLFYYKVVKQLLDIDNRANVSYLYRYAKIFSEYYDIFCHVRLKVENRDKVIETLLKNCFYYRLFYVYKNATLLSSAIALHIRNIYEQDADVIRRLINKKLVRICSIGGCSAIDICAVIIVLKSIALKNGIELDFRVTIIDLNEDWKNTSITVLRCLEEFHNAIWKINFIESNITNAKACKKPEILRAIREADVLTMVKFMSTLHSKKNIVKMICSKLQSEAMFFALDRPLTSLVELYLSTCDLEGLQLIDVQLCDYYTLDLEAVKQLRTLYQKHFGKERLLWSNIACNLFASVWMKVSPGKDKKPKDNIECAFQTSVEKYNPKQNFLCNNAVTRWENLFTKTKRFYGWNEKKIKKSVQLERQKRNDLFGKLIHEKKAVDSLQNRLLTNLKSFENDGEEISEINGKSLEDYLTQKRQYSLIKKKAYFASLSGSNLYYIIE